MNTGLIPTSGLWAVKKNLGNEIKNFRSALPKNEVPSHTLVSSAPTNVWFKEHLARNGLK